MQRLCPTVGRVAAALTALLAPASAQGGDGSIGRASRAAIQISVSVMPRFKVEANPQDTGSDSAAALGLAVATPQLSSNLPRDRYSVVLQRSDPPGEADESLPREQLMLLIVVPE